MSYIKLYIVQCILTHPKITVTSNSKKEASEENWGLFQLMIFKFHEFHVNSCYIIIIFIFGCKFSFHATFTCHSWVSLMGQASKFSTRSSSMAQFSSTFKSSTWHAKLHLDILAISFISF